MRKTEMLWFEDISPLNEPVLSFPVLGRLSMRQFFILGMASAISYEIFLDTHSPVSAVSACIGALLAFVRPNVGSTEWMMLSMILFLAGRRRHARLWNTVGKKRSKMPGKLVLARPLVSKRGPAAVLLRMPRLPWQHARKDRVRARYDMSQA